MIDIAISVECLIEFMKHPYDTNVHCKRVYAILNSIYFIDWRLLAFLPCDQSVELVFQSVSYNQLTYEQAAYTLFQSLHPPPTSPKQNIHHLKRICWLHNNILICSSRTFWLMAIHFILQGKEIYYLRASLPWKY